MYYIIRIMIFEQQEWENFMKIIVANWKMNGSKRLVSEYKQALKTLNKNKIIVCPPSVLIKEFENFNHFLGAQNCYFKDSGAFTGENSPKLLKEMGCEYVILGHSERREFFLESDELIFQKHEAAVKNNLVPIVCIGEKKDERSQWKQVLGKKLSFYKNLPLGLQTVFAYEPIWSIGTGLISEIEEICEVVSFIKEYLQGNFSVIYGGSVNSNNSRSILDCKNIDGVLIGGASLKIEEFLKIVS